MLASDWVNKRVVFEKLVGQEEGQGIPEYAVTLLVIAIPAVGTLSYIGMHLNELYITIVSAFP